MYLNFDYENLVITFFSKFLIRKSFFYIYYSKSIFLKKTKM